MAEFRGGAALEAKLAEIAAKLTKPGTLRVGFLEGGAYPDGTSVPMVAAINEFGAPSRGQPPRPYFRGMIQEKSPGWGQSLANQLKATSYDTPAALTRMGEGIKGQLQAAIRQYVGPPLASSTIAKKKGVTKQLIDTAHMLMSADFEVK